MIKLWGVALVGSLTTAGFAEDTQFAWQVPHAEVVADGPVDLRWRPQPFALEVGDQVRYIDFENGSDDRDGRTPQTAWKHHPWDAAAPARLREERGVDTYVFKRGVVYRGALKAAESGEAGAPIRLTSDPSWGSGEAVIAGSDVIEGAWERVSSPAEHGLPASSANQVWMTRLPEGTQPMLMWRVGADGSRERLPIAREPNWKVSDPYRLGSEWWRWQSTSIDYPALVGVDAEHLAGRAADSLVGATVWSDPPAAEFSWNPPEPSVVTASDPSGSVTFTANHPAKYPRQGSRYFLENLPAFVDEAGEWYYASGGAHAGTLYIWAPPSEDPNDVEYEVARRRIVLDIPAQSHLAITGLTFRGGNTFDPSFFNARREGHNVDKPWLSHSLGAVRLHGTCRDITVANCRFVDTATGIKTAPANDGDEVDDIVVRDSEFENIDEGAVSFASGTVWRHAPMGRVKRVSVLRNRMSEIGQRTVGGEMRGVSIDGGELVHVAGNVIHRTGGQGIDVHGGRTTGGLDSQMAKLGGRPLVRVLIHHNKATETLLAIQDFGGIESWNVGPSYVFNNISGIPVGWIRHNDWYHKNEAYYFDHQFKGYFFNNVGYGAEREDAWDTTMSSSFFNQAQGTMNAVFHNTGYNFRCGFYKMTETNNRELFLGNLAIDMSGAFFGHDKLKGNTTAAYANNLLVGKAKNVFAFWQGDQFATVEEFSSLLEAQPALATSVGEQTNEKVVRDAQAHDFRPLPQSPAIGNGVKVFVPWGLSAVTGEWHFRRHQADPTRLIGENLYLTDEHKAGGTDFNKFPHNDLRVEGAGLADYEAGTLEDWIDGALTFDGNRVAVQEKLDRTYQTTDLDMRDNSFIVEAVVRVDDATTDGEIARKHDGANGYALRVRGGNLQLALGGDVVVTAPAAMNDGEWRHVLAEIDRPTGVVRLFVDGKLATEKKIAATGSLANHAEFTVGKGLVGAIDFLRISRGSLVDAQTTIDELYAWQFKGPQLSDFAGRAPAGDRRAIGALEPASP